eukprot:PITA_36537
MLEEYNSIMVNDVWEVVSRPQDRSVVRSRWIYKIKYAANSSVEKYKANFVAKGHAQKEGIDYEETFAVVARYTSIKTVISLAAQMGGSCSADAVLGEKDQQQHGCRGSCHTDAAVAEPWAAVQRMLGKEAEHQHRDRCRMIRVILSEEYY